MTNSEIKEILSSNGVKHLYHTNTVETSLSFIKSGGLLSRGYCEDMGLPQTPQYTDRTDKEQGIFYDIFFDSVEIQRRTGVSYYGPVLFVYSVDVLDIIEEGRIRITKNNPINWHGRLSDSEKYFLEADELAWFFEKDNFGQHITIINQNQPLSFEYLEKVVLSIPQQGNNQLFDIAKITIEEAMDDNWLSVPLTVRDYNYNENFSKLYSYKKIIQEHFGLGGHKIAF